MNTLATTEIFKDGHFVAGPALPHPVEGHCMIRINETHSMLTGGKIYQYHDNYVSEQLVIQTIVYKNCTDCILLKFY